MIMQKKLDLWHILVDFGTGYLAFLAIVLGWMSIDLSRFKLVFHYLQTFSSIYPLFIMIPLMFITGTIIDALTSPLVGTLYSGLYRDSEEIAAMKEVVKKDVSVESLNPFVWAKTYCIQENYDSQYIIFISKFGLYRNFGVVLFLFGLFELIVSVYVGVCSLFILGLVLIVVAIFLIKRCKDFYDHSGRSVLTHYLVSKGKKDIYE